MAGSTRTPKAPVKTGAHRDIERQLGAPPLREADTGEGPPDFDRPMPEFKSRYQEHREAQAVERRQRREALKAPPRGPKAAPARSPRSSPSRGRARRTGRPTLADPTGGRLPIGFDGDGIAGAFFGAIFYALVLSVADYGVQGPLYWFKAKFLNQPAPPKR